MSLPDLNVLESGDGERAPEFALAQRAGDAAGPGGHVRARAVVHVGVGDHVRDGEPAAGPQHAGGLGDHLGLVAGEIDHAV